MWTLTHHFVRGFAALALCLTIAPATVQAEGRGVVWRPDYSDAAEEATRTGRLLLVHVSATWCGPCKSLEKEVYQNGETAQFIEQYYVPVKLDYDDNAELMKSWSVTQLPADLVMLGDGKTVVHRRKGYTSGQAAVYCRELQAVAQQTMQKQQAAAIAQRPPMAPPIAPAETAAQDNVAYPPGMASPTAPNTTASSAVPPQQTLSAFTAPPPTTNDIHGSSAMPVGSSIAGSPRANLGPPAAPQGPYSAQVPPAAPVAPSQPAAPAYQAPVAPAYQAPAAPPYQAPAAQQPPPQQAAAKPAAEAPLQLPPGAPPLAMDGYCSVTLYQSRVWRRGDPAYGVIHHGRLFLFVSEKEKQTFFAHPEVYSPAVAGNDPVLALDHGQYVPGTRQVGCYYRDRLFLFTSEETFARFNENADRYANEAVQAARPTAR